MWGVQNPAAVAKDHAMAEILLEIIVGAATAALAALLLDLSRKVLGAGAA